MTLNCCVLSLKRSTLTLWWCRSKQVFCECYLNHQSTLHWWYLHWSWRRNSYFLQSSTHLFRPCQPCQIFSIQWFKIPWEESWSVVSWRQLQLHSSLKSLPRCVLKVHSEKTLPCCVLLLSDSSHFILTLIKCHSSLITFVLLRLNWTHFELTLIKHSMIPADVSVAHQIFLSGCWQCDIIMFFFAFLRTCNIKKTHKLYKLGTQKAYFRKYYRKQDHRR